jgi:hypothetical protein
MVLSTQTVLPSAGAQPTCQFQDKGFGDWKTLGHEELSVALTFDRQGNWGGVFLEELDLVFVVAFLFQTNSQDPLYQVFLVKDKGYLQVDIPPGTDQAHVNSFGDPYVDLSEVQRYLSCKDVRMNVLFPCIYIHMGVVDCFKKLLSLTRKSTHC